MSGPLRNTLLSVAPKTSYDRQYSGAVLFDTQGKVILQVRDQKPTIVNPGMVTLFGGGQDPTETPLACIVRELREELELKVNATDCQFLGYIDKEETSGSITRCAIFVLYNISPSSLRLQEGQRIAIRSANVFLNDPLVSIVTKISIRAAVAPR